MAGNGGTMVDQHEAALNKAETEQNDKLAAKKSKAGIGKSRKAHSERPKRPGKQGDEADGSAGNEAKSNAELNERMKAQLCREANLALGEKCKAIANALVTKTIAGDARCATLLFALAEPSDKNASAAKKQRMMELVQELANEQEWTSEMNQAAEVMFDAGPGTRTETAVAMAAQ